MRKCAGFLAPLTLVAGCQMFTAGESVSEPDPAQVRAKMAERSPHKHETKAKAAPAEAEGETATASHILIRYAGSLRAPAEITRSKEDARRLAEHVLEKARAPGADFAALANEYTEDPSGKRTGGRLGTFGRGRMVPEFNKAVFSMSPGEVSDVIETAFGFHIIYREK